MPADLLALCDRAARSEQEIAAWHDRQGALARERAAALEGARTLAAEAERRAREQRETEAVVERACARLEELERGLSELRADLSARGRRSGEDRADPEPQAIVPARATDSPVESPAQLLAVETGEPEVGGDARGESASAGGTREDELSKIAHLMKSVEIAKVESEGYRRRLQEQSREFAAAYAMLARIRPLVETLEGELGASGGGGERPE